jgi:DNA repair protein RAD50
MPARYTKALDNIKAVRKERVAELKLDQERLSSLSKEKTHADKLKSRMKALKNEISKKESDHEELGKVYRQWVTRNQKLQESATTFREVFMKAESLEERQNVINADMKECLETLDELLGKPI